MGRCSGWGVEVADIGGMVWGKRGKNYVTLLPDQADNETAPKLPPALGRTHRAEAVLLRTWNADSS